jgi:uncharacterized protein
MMTKTTARVATPHGAKYVKQLVKHWSHKLDATMDGELGVVCFPDAILWMNTGEEGIHIVLAGEQEKLETLKGVVATHINRFAHREAPLSYEWS